MQDDHGDDLSGVDEDEIEILSEPPPPRVLAQTVAVARDRTAVARDRTLATEAPVVGHL